jgi:hypothetical protein
VKRGFYPSDSIEDFVKILDDQLNPISNPENDLFYLTKGNSTKVNTYVTANNVMQMIKLNIDKAIRAENAIIEADPYKDDGMYEIALGLLLMQNNMQGLGAYGIRTSLKDLGLSDLRPGVNYFSISYSGGVRGDLERLEDLAKERLRDAKGGRLRLAKAKDPDEENPLEPLKIEMSVAGPYQFIDTRGGGFYTDKERFDRRSKEAMSRALAEFPDMADSNYKSTLQLYIKNSTIASEVPVRSAMEKEFESEASRFVNNLFISYARGQRIRNRSELTGLKKRFEASRMYGIDFDKAARTLQLD